MTQETFDSQPGLRAYPVMTRVPAGCAIIPVANDDNDPIVHAGEFVVVDKQQRQAEAGELFVVAHSAGPPEIVEMYTKQHRNSAGPFVGWWTAPYNRPRSHEQVRASPLCRQRIPTCDGPYAGEAGIEYLTSKTVGRVIGIYKPDFDASALRSLN